MIKLVNRDCYEVLKEVPDNSIDLIYTDPPYDVDIFKPGSGGSVNNVMKLDVTLQPINGITQTDYDLELFCREALRVMKEPNIYIWCNKKQIMRYMNFFVNEHECKFDILVWNKTNALPTYSNKYIDDCEYCLYFHKGKGKCFPKSYNDAKKVFVSPINRENKLYNHPNIKPLDYVRSHISNSSRPGDVILDPFMGTGTSGLATKELGERTYIGVEINPDYYATANMRINGVVENKQEGESNEKFDLW